MDKCSPPAPPLTNPAPTTATHRRGDQGAHRHPARRCLSSPEDSPLMVGEEGKGRERHTDVTHGLAASHVRPNLGPRSNLQPKYVPLTKLKPRIIQSVG